MCSRFDANIRPYRIGDFPAVYDAVCESMRELVPWMPWCRPGYSIDDSRTWIENQISAFRQGTAFEFAIVSASGRYLGGCGLNRIDTMNRRANLGYWVRSGSAGHGVATAAVKLIRSWGFQNTEFIRLEILAAAGNLASRRVAQKAGAEYEGVLRNRLILQGSPHDAAVYSFIRE